MNTLQQEQEIVFVYGSKLLPEKRKVKPTGRLYLLGKHLTVEETSNYLKSGKKARE